MCRDRDRDGMGNWSVRFSPNLHVDVDVKDMETRGFHLQEDLSCELTDGDDGVLDLERLHPLIPNFPMTRHFAHASEGTQSEQLVA